MLFDKGTFDFATFENFPARRMGFFPIIGTAKEWIIRARRRFRR